MTARSYAELYCCGSSSPTGVVKCESCRPSASTCAFMVSTNVPSPTVSCATAVAASLALAISIAVTSSCTVNISPVCNPSRVSTTSWLRTSGVIVTCRLRSKFSIATSVVMILVRLAGA